MTVVIPASIAALVAFLVAIAPITGAISTVNAVVSTSNAVRPNLEKDIAKAKARIAALRAKHRKPPAATRME
jgi:hypothetical protein